MFPTGEKNLITDVGGLKVGNSHCDRLKSGVTVVLAEQPAVAGVKVLGGAPGTRETDLLAPHTLVQHVDAIVLSGGSAFGLDAASGVQAALREMGRGFEAAGYRVPIVPAAILFDLANGGDKNWGRFPPYRELGYEALQNTKREFSIGSEGAGAGALTHGLKGGLGSASTLLPDGIIVGALVAVNSVGSVTVGNSAHFWAAPFERENEFGGLGLPSPLPPDASTINLKSFNASENTTIGVVATDARLDKSAATRLAIAAHDGLARAIWPAHTPLDGDLVFAMSTGAQDTPVGPELMIRLCAAATATMARAIAKGVYAAERKTHDIAPTWREKFG